MAYGIFKGSCGVINRLVGVKFAQKIKVDGRGADDLGSTPLGDPHGNVPDPARGDMDENGLSVSQIS
jgi:hypothetical protein